MASHNSINLIGRLTADPELRHTTSGHAVCSFTVAVARKFSKNDETDFIPVQTWRRLAEICAEYLHKGKLIHVEGRLQTRIYEANDGQRRKAFEVVAETMNMLDGARAGGVGAQQSGQARTQQQKPKQLPRTEEQLGIDDIPF